MTAVISMAAGLRITFSVSTPLFLPLKEDAAEAAINKSILSRLEPQTNSRQKQWSDHNYFLNSASTEPYQQRERRAYAC